MLSLADPSRCEVSHCNSTFDLRLLDCMGKLTDLTGQKFGLLTVIERVPNLGASNRNPRWRCKCECGGETIAFTQHLRNGHTTSCGCRRHLKYALKHGRAMNPGPTYRAWLNMRNRCNNPKTPQYKYYGALGVTVCDRWESFENFLADRGERPVGRYELDRIDPRGNYTPENTRWIPTHSGRKRRHIE